jgi:hypothetical protein
MVPRRRDRSKLLGPPARSASSGTALASRTAAIRRGGPWPLQSSLDRPWPHGHWSRVGGTAPELLGPPARSASSGTALASRALVPRRRDRSRAPWTARLFGKLRDCVGLTGTGPASAGPLQAPWNAESPYLAVRVRAFSPPACNRSVNSVTSRGRDGSGARRPPVPGSDAHVEGERLASRLELTEALHPLPRRPCTRTLHSVVSLRPGERSEICRQQGPSWSPPTPPTTRHA